MKRPWQLLSFLILSLSMTAWPDPVGGGSLKVTLRQERSRPLNGDLYGVNCEMMRRMSYLDRGFQDLYQLAGRPLIRYPGGTTANYWNPLTGFMDVFPGHEKRSVEANAAISKRTGGRGEPWEEFFRFVQEAGATYSLTLNLCTVPVESNEIWLSHLKSRGIEPRMVEMGNEVHYHEYVDFLTNGRDYGERSELLARMVRERFPKAKIGVVVPNGSFTEEVFLDELKPGHQADRRFDEWIQALTGRTFFDAVVLHLYSTYGMAPETAVKDFWPMSRAYRHAMAHQDARFDACMEVVGKLFPGKEIWLTEYHLGGWSPTLRQYPLSDSYLGSLHSMAMLLKALARPEITVTHRNTFMAMLGGTTAKDGVTKVRNVNFRHFTLVGEALRGSEAYVALDLEGCGTYEGEGKYAGNYPDVEGGVFLKGKQGFLILVNKMGRSYRFESLNLAAGKSPTRMVRKEWVQYAPRRDVPEEKAFEDRFVMEEKQGDSTGALEVPGYSLTRVFFVIP